MNAIYVSDEVTFKDAMLLLHIISNHVHKTNLQFKYFDFRKSNFRKIAHCNVNKVINTNWI